MNNVNYVYDNLNMAQLTCIIFIYADMVSTINTELIIITVMSPQQESLKATDSA